VRTRPCLNHKISLAKQLKHYNGDEHSNFFDESDTLATPREQLQFLISILDMRAFLANELIRIALCDDDMSSANYDDRRLTTGIWINLGKNWRRRDRPGSFCYETTSRVG
jgi:hypothetical protein